MKFYYKEMTFEVPETVYYPREDSGLLAGVLEKMDMGGKKALEVGCGSGFLSVLMARQGASVTAVDISEEAVAATKRNAEANNVSVNCLVSDIFSGVKADYDIIVFNPPYLPVEEGETDKTYAGGCSGREVIERFVAEAENHLKPNSTILLVVSSLTGEKEVMKLFKEAGMAAQAVAREKVPWEELIVLEAALF